MADGVAITAGSGTTILTDDTGAGGHAQVMKLAISTDGSGTLIPADGTAGLKVDLGADNDVVAGGNVAHDSADSGNPVKVGGKARTTNPTAVADADRVDATFDDVGRQVVVLNGVRDLETHATTTISSATETTILAAGASGVFHDLTLLVITNTSGTTVRVDFRDATAGSVVLSVTVAAGGGGAVIPFAVPLKQATAANNWTAQLASAVTDVRFFVQAVKNV